MAATDRSSTAPKGAGHLVASAELKARVLDTVYESDSVAILTGYGLLAAKHRTTGVGVIVVEGDFNQAAYKQAVAELKAAGIKTSRMYVYGRIGSYSGAGICFTKLQDIGIDVSQSQGSTSEVSRSVCRIGYGFADVTVRVATGASDAEIEAAVLDAAGNYTYSEKDAQYELEGSAAASSTQLAINVLAGLLDRLSGLGFSADEEIDGADAIGEISEAYSVAVEQLKGTPHEPFVIFSASEDGFWNKDVGWVDVESATHYFRRPTDMPMSSANDAKLARLSEADQLSLQTLQAD